MDDTVICDWGNLSDEDAIDIAVERHARDPVTSLAYCAWETDDGTKGPEYRFWFSLFLKTVQQRHVGWA